MVHKSLLAKINDDVRCASGVLHSERVDRVADVGRCIETGADADGGAAFSGCWKSETIICFMPLDGF